MKNEKNNGRTKSWKRSCKNKLSCSRSKRLKLNEKKLRWENLRRPRKSRLCYKSSRKKPKFRSKNLGQNRQRKRLRKKKKQKLLRRKHRLWPKRNYKWNKLLLSNRPKRSLPKRWSWNLNKLKRLRKRKEKKKSPRKRFKFRNKESWKEYVRKN